ncbi:MAG TPA: hypothetical protein ENI17_04845 [Pseudomonas xinjiangensis]|uniref:Uncharacterized protein n=2 Tax=root TaxID=1 RepID=A0A7V1BL20_9GAMM|nr:hypothetical protein [Halopseudomonas xinjiangensis]HEC46938.1 hypothetical protein [Halopseudomonas xinjiangensis]
MYVLQIFDRQESESEQLENTLAPVFTEILAEVRFYTTHSEPAEVEGGWLTVHKRLRGVAEFINQLKSIAELDKAILDSIGFIKSDSPKVSDFKEVVTLNKVSAETGYLAGYSCFNLRCELEDGRVYCFTPVMSSVVGNRSDLLYQHP